MMDIGFRQGKTPLTTFRKAVFIGEGHFKEGQAFEEVKFHVPARRDHLAEEEMEADMEKLIKWEEQKNAAIRKARADVERVIHEIKGPWKTLNTPWAEELNQLSYLVHIAAAVYNKKK